MKTLTGFSPLLDTPVIWSMRPWESGRRQDSSVRVRTPRIAWTSKTDGPSEHSSRKGKGERIAIIATGKAALTKTSPLAVNLGNGSLRSWELKSRVDEMVRGRARRIAWIDDTFDDGITVLMDRHYRDDIAMTVGIGMICGGMTRKRAYGD